MPARKSPEEKRATEAARKARYRARKRAQEQQVEYADRVLGFEPGAAGQRPPGMSETDVAKLLRDRYHSIIDGMDDVDLMQKDFAPGFNVALKAQAILDKREERKAHVGGAELAFALIALVEGRPVPKQLEDGVTVEGEYVEAV